MKRSSKKSVNRLYRGYKPPLHLMPWYNHITAQIYLYLLSKAYVNTRKENDLLVLPCCCLVTLRELAVNLPQKSINKTTFFDIKTIRKKLSELEAYDEIRLISREGNKGTIYLVTRKWDGVYGDTMNISQFFADSPLVGVATLNEFERRESIILIDDARESVLKRGLVKIKDAKLKKQIERYAEEANNPFNQKVISVPDPKDILSGKISEEELFAEYLDEEEILGKELAQIIKQDKLHNLLKVKEGAPSSEK